MLCCYYHVYTICKHLSNTFLCLANPFFLYILLTVVSKDKLRLFEKR